MNLFKMDLTALTFEDIENFCVQDIAESVRLDYKAELSKTAPQKQVSKAVSALANTQGGVLVFGVGTRPNTNRPAWPSGGMPTDPAFEARVVRWCIEHIEPPLTPQVGYITNPTNTAMGFGVVRIEPSLFTPHTVDGGTRVYVRRADNSDPCDATIHEIERLRDRRRLEVEQQARHQSDLSDRIAPPETRRDRRAFALIVTPAFSVENAIPFRDLPGVAEELRKRGFKIGDVRSYSQGLVAKHHDGFNFAITNRAGLAFSHVLLPVGAPVAQQIELESLLGWCLLAATAVRTLAVRSSYWGSYRIWFEARNWGGIPVVDSGHAEDYAECADNHIELEDEWSTLDVRDDPLVPAHTLYSRLMWAFGQFARIWPDGTIRTRLERYAKERGVL